MGSKVRKQPPHKQALAHIRALADQCADPQATTEFLQNVYRGVEQQMVEYQNKLGPMRHMHSVRERVEAWIAGTLDIGKAPALDDAQTAELRALLDKTTILNVDAEEVERGYDWVTIDFKIGNWTCQSKKEYSFGRETSASYIGNKLYTSYTSLSLSPRSIDMDTLRAAARKIPTELPLAAVFLYIFLVAFDDNLFTNWNPWIDDVDLSSLP